MKFTVGDKVKVIDETFEGIVTEIISSHKVVIEIDSFPYVYKPSQLVSIESIPTVAVDMKLAHKEELEVDKKTSKKHQRRGKTVEIDLHIHQLIDSSLGLTNGEMLQIQLNKFRKELEKAIRDRFHKIIFIHGVGEGVLCDEIRRELTHYDAVSFSDASFLEYGNGATEVIIYNNH
jgi:dsDNA-specific endonuclease/ATPase MutS2